jgi:hypothetical protein
MAVAGILSLRATYRIACTESEKDSALQRTVQMTPGQQMLNTVFYFCSKTNEMHQFLKFISSRSSTLHGLEVFPSIIRSLRVYIQHQVYVKQILLTA